jgi:hypothetical protein
MCIIKYVSNPSYREEVNRKRTETREFRENVQEYFEERKKDSKLEKLLLKMTLSEFEKKMGITKEMNDLGLYPADGC